MTTETTQFRPLPEEYKANTFIFRLVRREGQVAMYQGFDVDGDEEMTIGFEVFEVIQRPEEYVGPKRYLQPPREATPLPSQWGTNAFSPGTRELADLRFAQIKAMLSLRQVERGTAKGNKNGDTKKSS